MNVGVNEQEKKVKKQFKRSAGILMPISSLPSPYGIGTLGKAAYEFVDFVQRTRHKYWQVLPIGPTSYGDSPYQSYSSFAGNPYFIDLDILIEEGLLQGDYLQLFDWGNDDYVDYEKMFSSRFSVLATAHEAFRMRFNGNKCREYEEFAQENKYWLEDYALYMACKAHFGYEDWSKWKDEIKFREKSAIEKYRVKLEEDINFWKFCQYQFFKQWKKLKAYANQKGIEIIGDIPIYTALDSADVWAEPGLFQLDEDLLPTDVAGVPPDAFTDLGQRWGNPLYNWDKMKKDNYAWWAERMKKNAETYDVLRIDHFIGIVRYYSIPAESPDAKTGKYKEGPAQGLLDVINQATQDKKIIAEDLGIIMPEVDQLLEANGYPGMKVLEFAFGGNRDNPHLPYNYKQNTVVYGGTHDNETLYGFFTARNDDELAYAFDYLDTRDRKKLVDEIFRAAYGSVANVVIFQVQDILKLDNTARMNFPSTLGENWKWRMKKNELTEKHENEIRYLASVFGREV